MDNLPKLILIIIFVMLLLVIFFALTGVDLRRPEEAMYIMVEKVLQFNRAVNQMFRNLFWSIRTTVTGWFGQ